MRDFFYLLLDKARVFLKSHIRNNRDGKSSFELVLNKGRDYKAFKASNVSEESTMKAFDEFLKIAKSKDLPPSSEIDYDHETNKFIDKQKS